MLICKKTSDLRRHLAIATNRQQTIGFVPTMGALHAGHLSLIGASKRANPVTVCSIFVNPTQFNNRSDFEKYPTTIEKDIEMLHDAGCEVLFLPHETEIYPVKPSPEEHYDLGFLETVLEGPMRPGHFQGVCQVVRRLFEAVQPDHAYFGSKDYQQCMVIQRLVELMQPYKPIQLHLMPTLREADGLAMSSRNMRLNPAERALAPTIYQTLLFLKQILQPGQLLPLTEVATRRLNEAGFRTDYVSLSHARSLAPLNEWDGQTPLVCLIAAFLNDVRLIDNMVLTENQ
jgi:pantoate--beta-alanine ligase